MKKKVLIIMLVGFAVGAKAKNDPESTDEIINECVTETADTASSYKKKKHKRRMAMFKARDTRANLSVDNNPYYFAAKDFKVLEYNKVLDSAVSAYDSAHRNEGEIVTRNIKTDTAL